MKEVLVIHYSQTGQLTTILENMVAPISKESVHVTYYEIKPIKPFEFPWGKDSFYDVFPETFLQIPSEVETPPEEILNKDYDLVILGYQVWFLTPSVPINSFLKSNAAKKLLNNTPVVTVVACRNMWLQAQEKVKRLLVDADANLVGHLAFVDKHINHISVVTIEYWMLSGKKDRYLGIFPKPGVSDKDIAEAYKYAPPIKEAVLKNDFSTLQETFIKLGGVIVNPYLVMTDKRGNVIFSKWANHIIKKGKPGEAKRLKTIKAFKYYLLFAIWVIAPIVFIVFLFTYLPTSLKRKREREYFSSVYLKENS
ncbi:dialkylrecorsinol condensing enzyme DarA [Maribacter sp.]|uniref:dialkylrecorsinol condensing enzyme DarA n=1 Tax=Maribacter sp. TaxID=1897614 RepID=UPI0025BD4860|nr:dialkylrecorsinol condensing enzyme DarA [Maribacter sp.]